MNISELIWKHLSFVTPLMNMFYLVMLLPGSTPFLSLSFLQKKATDPSRFTNRGGNLLKEEKQRSDLLKSLPKVKSEGHLLPELISCSINRVCASFLFKDWKEIKSPDWHLGTWAGSRLSSKRPEVSAVRGGAVGAAQNREGEGKAGEGKECVCIVLPAVFANGADHSSFHNLCSTLRKANKRRRTCCTEPQYEPQPSAGSWPPPPPINHERW